MKKWRRFLWVFLRTIVLIGLSIPFAYGVIVIGAHLFYFGGCTPFDGPRFLCSEAEYQQEFTFGLIFIMFMVSWLVFTLPFSFMLTHIIRGYKNKKIFRAVGLTLLSLVLLAPIGISSYYGTYFLKSEKADYLIFGPKIETPIPGATSIPSNQEAWPGLTGEWWDPQTSSASPGFVSLPTYVIVWQNGKYVVVSCSDPQQGYIYPITSQSWTGSTLTWSYTELHTTWTIMVKTAPLDTDSLKLIWSTSDGTTGAKDLIRAQCQYPVIASSTPQSTDQGPDPNLSGKWQDPETNNTFVIAWQNGQYVVTTATREGISYDITTQYWSSCHLTWSFEDSYLSKTVTFMSIGFLPDMSKSSAAFNYEVLHVQSLFNDGTLGTDFLNRIK